MEKWYSRFRRGDVWYLKLDSEDGDGIRGSSVQKKSRPYLIVSCEENNLNSPTINAIPICTRDNDHLPMHVFYVYQDGSSNGRNQTILCEQVTTVSVMDFDRKGSYFMYSLNLDLMNEVDETLTRQLGLKPRVADMKVIERLINELASKKEEEIKKEKEKELNARVEKIVENLAKRFGINLTAEVLQNNTEYRDAELTFADKETVKEMRQTAADRKASVKNKVKSNTVSETKPVNKTNEKTKKSTNTSEAKTTTTTRNSWTKSNKMQFIEDYKTLSLSEMSEKWHIKKKSIQQMAYMFKKDLKNVT